jgi:hypothetical protein
VFTLSWSELQVPFYVCLNCVCVAWDQTQGLHMLGKHSTTELYTPRSTIYIFKQWNYKVIFLAFFWFSVLFL